MKIFISWSGERSREVADFLHEWIVCVLQAARPWASTRDLDRGSLWFSEINDQLKDTAIGIICLTQENKNRPWILFEAGALAKGLSNSRVCTFLIDLQVAEVRDPLGQFNHTLPTKEGIYGLVRTLNNQLGVMGLEARTLNRVFEKYWPDFEQKFAEILARTPQGEAGPPPDGNLILSEILSNTRSLSARLSTMEMRTSSPPMKLMAEWREMALDLLLSNNSTPKIIKQMHGRGCPPSVAKAIVDSLLEELEPPSSSGS